MTWRLANALVALRNGVNARWPRRDKRSDGTIGDAAHAARASDHNPWVIVGGLGVVRAIDIDVDGIDAAWLAEQLRKLGAAGDRRLRDGGYLILNGRITRADFSGWVVYTGTNRHTAHLHVSFSRTAAGFDDGRPWSFLSASPTPSPTPSRPTPDRPTPARPTLRRGSTGALVRDLQAFLRRVYPRYAGNLAADGMFGLQTEAAVREFQRRSRLAVDGIVGPKTWAALHL